MPRDLHSFPESLYSFLIMMSAQDYLAVIEYVALFAEALRPSWRVEFSFVQRTNLLKWNHR